MLAVSNFQAKTCQALIESIEKGQGEFDLLISMLSYLFKKNIRFYYLKNQAVSAVNEDDISSPGPRFGELNLSYDNSPE
jgi:hypothetical protein